jgi:hypothetical protein
MKLAIDYRMACMSADSRLIMPLFRKGKYY